MKILHTADWHIGKTLHKQSLQDQFLLFFDWLIDIIKTESIDVLLVSGDIFDLANPSADDRQLYYRFLTRLIGTDTKIILTGGNHDSVGLLNAPKDILNELNITVIGGATENIEHELIAIKDDHGTPQLVVAAVPFLRDKDLRNKQTDEIYKNRTEAIREGIRAHYRQLADICANRYPQTPIIAMGHLYAVGAERSESERDIHVGNTAAVDSSYFPPIFDYVALGHIHRPQIIGGNEFIRYSGSPVALSFSEKTDNKSVVMLELENGIIKPPTVIPTPKHRELKKITGDLERVKNKLSSYQVEFKLPSFIELEIKEAEYSSMVISEVEDLKHAYRDHDKFRILLSKTKFESGAKNTADLFEAGEKISDLSPPEVFAKRLESENLNKETAADLIEAFRELYELALQGEGI
jgi:exonuclease SbcD